MSNDPQLLFVAGPNGAGKSTFSKTFSRPGAVIFDVDKVIPRIEAKSPWLTKQQIYNEATDEFFRSATTAVKRRQDFTLETHFRDEGLIDIEMQFRDFGYHTNLIYLTLRDIQRSTERVDERVRQGGNHAHEKDIIDNYNEGLRFLEQFGNRFDDLTIYDTSDDIEIPELLLNVERHQLRFLANIPPTHIEKIPINLADFYNNRGNDLSRYEL